MSIASLRLTMPKQNLHISRETAALYRDVLVNQVLSVADFNVHLEKVVNNLHNLNRMPLNGDARLALTNSLINQYLLFIRQVRSGEIILEASKTALLPELNREFSFASKLLLRDAIAHSKEELANFVYWTLSSLCEHLYDYSAQRRTQPGAIWSEINRLYEYAEARYLTDFQTNKPDHRDIQSRFIQALMFQTVQPEHLNDQELRLITLYLYKWSHKAQLHHQESREFNARYFYVDLQSPTGALSARQVSGAANDSHIRALNPLPLIDQARLHMGQLRNNLSIQKIGFTQTTDNIDAFMTLKKALMSWKQASSRRFERADCLLEGQTAIGLTNIHRYLRSPATGTQALISSATVNMSKTGACIKLEDTFKQDEVAVGDVIIHKMAHETNGRLAVIRWLKRVGETLMFGIEYIVGNLQPVMVRAHDRIAEALLISASDHDSLITHKGYCANNTPIKLKTARQGLTVDARAQSLMQRGQHVDQIRLKRSQIA